MARYKTSEDDLLDHLRHLEERLSKLERTPQLPNAAVDSGSVTVYSGRGSIVFVHSDGTTEMVRIGLFDSFFGPVDKFSINYLDGAPAIEFQSNLFGFENWAFLDSSGNVVLTVQPRDPNAHGEGVGLDRPYIPQPVFSAANPTDTNATGTFATLQRGWWLKQHPGGTFWVQYNVTSTTAEVQINALGETVVGPIVLPNGTGIVNIGTFSMPGDFFEEFQVEYQARVASGAGLVGIRVAAAGSSET